MTVQERCIPETRSVSIDQISAQLLGENYASGYLMNRDKLGIPLRHRLMQQLKVMEGETLVIDFFSIKEMTTSVAEEIGPNLFEEFMVYRAQKRDIYMAYCNVSDEIGDGLEDAFLGRQSRLILPDKLTIVAFGKRQNGQFSEHRFLGETVPDALGEALDWVYRLGEVNSSGLEELGVRAASRKLNELFKQYPWLLCRSPKLLDVGSRAWAYFYSPIVSMLGSQE